MIAESQQGALTARQSRILAALCSDYIVHGEAVASGGLVQVHDLPWSSATVRHELAQLERDGWVRRSHHSSGRLPTRSGMQRYVESLPRDRAAPPQMVGAVERSLRERGRDPEHDLRATVCVLSEMAGCVAVSFVGSERVGVIADVDVVPLVGARALVALEMEHGTTLLQAVNLDRLLDSSGSLEGVVEGLRDRLRALCRGRRLTEARAELLERMQAEQARLDRLLAEALWVGLSLCSGGSLDPLVVQVAGQPALARGDGPQGDRLGEVLELLADYHRLADVLCELLPEADADGAARVGVRVGTGGLDDASAARALDDAGLRGIEGLTVVGCRMQSEEGSDDGDGGSRCAKTGGVAVLGSSRLDYAAVIPLVEYAARALSAHVRS